MQVKLETENNVKQEIKSGDVLLLENGKIMLYKAMHGYHMLIHLNGFSSIGTLMDISTQEELLGGIKIKKHYSSKQWALQLVQLGEED